MTSRYLRWIFLALAFLSTVHSGFVQPETDPDGERLVEVLLFTFVILMWVNADSRERNVTVTRLFKVGVVCMAGIFVPLYVIRTRGWPAGAQRLGVFVVQLIGISMSGAIVGLMGKQFLSA